MDNIIGVRLREERKRLGLTQPALGEAGGVKVIAQSNYENGKRIPGGEYFSAVADHGVDVLYVLTGTRSTETISPHTSGTTGIPLYDLEAAAGDGKDVLDESQARAFSIDEEILAPRGVKPDQCVMLSISGDSMLPTLSDGDVVVFDRSQSSLGDGIYLFEMDGQLRVKRLQRVAGGAYALLSDNDKYQPVYVAPNELNTLRIIGRCVCKIGAVS